MEILKYIVDDQIIAELLGRNNFTNKESAILELVKNAYDASANICRIIFKPDQIIFFDDGEGMDENTIKAYWMHVGISSRTYKSKISERIYAGEKGIGRFALARLGNNIEIISHRKESVPIKWTSDWISTRIEKLEEARYGTTIIISNLRDKWNHKSITNLINYLSTAYLNNTMKIEIVDLEKIIHKIEYKFINPKIGTNFYSSIKFCYNAKDLSLSVQITCDEFSEEVKKEHPEINFENKSIDINIRNEQKGQDWNKIINRFATSSNQSDTILSKIGSFSGQFFFYTKHILKDSDNRVYKVNSLIDNYESGIVLYRNAFTTAGYDGSTEWLGLNSRSRKSPSATTHRTGQWRIRSNQISGNVVIDKKENAILKELSNRQGFEQDAYYAAFIFLITKVLEEFERFRQNIIREVTDQPDVTPIVLTILRDIASGKKYIRNLNTEEQTTLKNGINEALKWIDTLEKNIETKRYDMQLLNTLSTIGLMAASIAHELKHAKSEIDTDCEYIELTLKDAGLWDILNSPKYTDYKSTNVPILLDTVKTINKKVVNFLNVMLENLEKSRFLEDANIPEVMDRLKGIWEHDYANMNINYIIEDVTDFKITEDRLETIFNNLLLNSEQQNSKSQSISINIKIKQKKSSLDVLYSDNGSGLDPKYRNQPFRILEANETTRPNGHGLGMWIVNNTIVETGGSVDDIKPIGPGFEIMFHLESR